MYYVTVMAWELTVSKEDALRSPGLHRCATTHKTTGAVFCSWLIGRHLPVGRRPFCHRTRDRPFLHGTTRYVRRPVPCSVPDFPDRTRHQLFLRTATRALLPITGHGGRGFESNNQSQTISGSSGVYTASQSLYKYQRGAQNRVSLHFYLTVLRPTQGRLSRFGHSV